MFVRGNRLKLKHEGQNRTPICGICKERGHYRNECAREEINIYTDRDNLRENRRTDYVVNNSKEGKRTEEKK